MPRYVERISAETDPKYGVEPEKRSVVQHLSLGIIPLDKPCGPSSHEVSSWVRKMVGAEKAGHSGTLDPQVSGVLPVALDNATKALTFMLKSNKEYVGIIRFHKKLDAGSVRKLFSEHVGRIKQIPRVRSAVRRVERERMIYMLEMIELSGCDALLRVSCQAGTYIRKLCHDMGKRARVGANMLELRRTLAAGFSESDCCTLQELSDALWLWKEKEDESEIRKLVIPIERVLKFKRIVLVDGAVEAVCAGAQLALPGVVRFEEGIQKDETVMLMSLKGELVAVSTALMDGQMMKEQKKGFVAKTKRVIMLQGTYPRQWKRPDKHV